MYFTRENAAMTHYFYCDWEQRRAWMTDADFDAQSKCIGQVKWRGTQYIVKLMVITGPTNTIKKPEKPPLDVFALLKSNLQKQIRRGKVLAVATAAKMWELSQFELLRRLAIISAEDTELSAQTAVIVWLMAAKSKGLVLTPEHRAWALGYVKALAESPRAPVYSRQSKPVKDVQQIFDHPTNRSIDRRQREILAGIMFRAAYGGLACDPPMLCRAVHYYLCTATDLPEIHVVEWTGELPRLRINRAAVDHHIFPGITARIQAVYDYYSPEMIKTAIWECSSSINVRYQKKIDADVLECWDTIQVQFKKLGLEHVKRVFVY